MARMKGGGNTPQRLVELLLEEVAKSSQSATARATGLTLRGVQNYIKGIGEPTQATLEKLAAYFGVSVGWLRGELSDEEERRRGLLESIEQFEMPYNSRSKRTFREGEQESYLKLTNDLVEIFSMVPDRLKSAVVKSAILVAEQIENLLGEHVYDSVGAESEKHKILDECFQRLMDLQQKLVFIQREVY